MKRSPFYLFASLLLAFSFALASCAPAAAPTTEASQAPAVDATQRASEAEAITVIFPKHEADLNGAFEGPHP